MRLGGRVCVVTGATSGIGRALAVAFVGEGAHVWALGRSRERMDALIDELGAGGGFVAPVLADLELDEDVGSAAAQILEGGDRIDVLVHSAGAIWLGAPESAAAGELDRLYRVNVRAPLQLTEALLPALRKARGQVVFVNSSAANRPSVANAMYAATKRDLRAVADSLRDEVNPDGVRVLSVYAGRTATPMQEAVHEHEHRTYTPQLLMRPEDVTHVVLAALTLPPSAEITDVSLRPMAKLPSA